MSTVKSKYIWILIAFLTAFITPVHGQSTLGSNIVSRTQLSSDSPSLLVQRVYDNGLGNVTRKFGVKPRELAQVESRGQVFDSACNKRMYISVNNMRTRIVYSCMPMIQNQKPVPVIQLYLKTR